MALPPTFRLIFCFASRTILDALMFAVPFTISASSDSRSETDCPTTVRLRGFSTRS